MDDQTNLSYVTQHVLLIPQSRESLFNFLRFNLRPSLSKAAARAELVFTDPDFPQPVFQLPDIIQPEFIFFPRSSVWMDPPAFRVTNSISCKPLQSPPEMDSLPSPTHAFSAFCQCAHFHTSIPSPHSPFSHSHSAQLCTCFSAQGITCQHLVHILNWENNHEIWFFLRVWKYPPGLKETDRSLWTRKKKWKCGVIINNGSSMPAAKMKIIKFQGLFSPGLQDSYRKSAQSWQNCPTAEDLYNKNKRNKI